MSTHSIEGGTVEIDDSEIYSEIEHEIDSLIDRRIEDIDWQYQIEEGLRYSDIVGEDKVREIVEEYEHLDEDEVERIAYATFAKQVQERHDRLNELTERVDSLEHDCTLLGHVFQAEDRIQRLEALIVNIAKVLVDAFEKKQIEQFNTMTVEVNGNG